MVRNKTPIIFTILQSWKTLFSQKENPKTIQTIVCFVPFFWKMTFYNSLETSPWSELRPFQPGSFRRSLQRSTGDTRKPASNTNTRKTWSGEFRDNPFVGDQCILDDNRHGMNHTLAGVIHRTVRTSKCIADKHGENSVVSYTSCNHCSRKANCWIPKQDQTKSHK